MLGAPPTARPAPDGDAPPVSKCLRGLLVGHRCLDPHVPRLAADGFEHVAESVRARLHGVVAADLGTPVGGEPTAAFLARLHQELRDAVAPRFRQREVVRDFLSDLAGQFRSAIAEGEVEPFRDVFGLVADVARTYYAHAGVAPAGVDPAATAFEVLHAERKPHDYDCPYAVSGKTRYLRPRVACLTVWLKGFDWESGLAVPYVLLHECLVHAYQGVCGRGAEVPDPYSSFSEGWMDAVTVLVLRRVLADHPPAPGLAWSLPDRERQRRVAERFHHARLDYYVRVAKAAPWHIGGQAAQQFRTALRDLLGDAAAADDFFLRFSLAVNASPVDHRRRDELARRLEAVLPKPGQGYAPGTQRLPPHKVRFLGRLRGLVAGLDPATGAEEAVDHLIYWSRDL